MKDITVVTGFYDIGRGSWGTHPQHGNFSRSVDTYFGYFSTLAELKNPMVVVTSSKFEDRIYSIRKKLGLLDLTKVITKDLPSDQLQKISNNMTSLTFQNYVVDNQIPEFKNPGYPVVTNQKTQMVMDAINSGFVQTSQTAWIDFGYCRKPGWFNATKPWEYDFGDKLNLWALRNPGPDIRGHQQPIFDVVRTAMIYFMGCHMVGPTSSWNQFNVSWQASWNSLIECGFSDDDQTTMLMVWRKNPELFTLHQGRDLGPGSWYFILSQFNDNANATKNEQTTSFGSGFVFDAAILK